MSESQRSSTTLPASTAARASSIVGGNAWPLATHPPPDSRTPRSLPERNASRRALARLDSQPRASTVCRAVSTPHCPSGVRCPTRSPRRVTSTAPTCSTSTRVRIPSTSISGRNEAGRALVEVGATNTTERGRRGSACTTTPYRGPYCSCPTPLGSRNAKTLPRRTQAFHDAGDREHFRPVVFVGF